MINWPKNSKMDKIQKMRKSGFNITSIYIKLCATKEDIIEALEGFKISKKEIKELDLFVSEKKQENLLLKNLLKR